MKFIRLGLNDTFEFSNWIQKDTILITSKIFKNYADAGVNVSFTVDTLKVDNDDTEFVEHVEAGGQSNVADEAGRIQDMVRDYRVETVFIDETGLGGGLGDMCNERQRPVS